MDAIGDALRGNILWALGTGIEDFGGGGPGVKHAGGAGDGGIEPNTGGLTRKPWLARGIVIGAGA